ncbi:MAG: glycosyltransferase [Cytophagaceae bacterium]|nr:glycosyltransferase [Cytophagaceae bacterium]
MHKSKIHFVVIGSGPKENLLRGIEEENLSFFGRLTNSETANIVSKCHLGLSLRDNSIISREAFPVKLYEYMGAGIPSISTPINEGGQLIERLKMGLNVENNEEQIISSILKCQKDRVFYNSLVKNILVNSTEFKREYIIKKNLSSLV